MHLKIKILDESVREFYENHGHFHQGDAGLDLYCPTDKLIGGRSICNKIGMGIACQPDDGKAYWMIPRSSISKTPLRLANSVGLIDGGYTGELMAMVDCVIDYPYTVDRGDRLFQIVAMDGLPITYEIVSELNDTTRGSGGFGSTGK